MTTTTNIEAVNIGQTEREARDILVDVIDHTVKTIERQLELIADRAPGNYLDKRPVVQSLTAHKARLQRALVEVERKARAASPASASPSGEDAAEQAAAPVAESHVVFITDRTQSIDDVLPQDRRWVISKAIGLVAGYRNCKASETKEAMQEFVDYMRSALADAALPRASEQADEVLGTPQQPTQSGEQSGAMQETVKIYETYTGQNGWLEVSQEEYDRTKDKYEHRIRRVPAPLPRASEQADEAVTDGVAHFNWLCSLMPEGFHWGEPLTPDVLDRIASAARAKDGK